jgi:hypothetical protein
MVRESRHVPGDVLLVDAADGGLVHHALGIGPRS